MTNQRQAPAWWQLMARNFPVRQFMLGALVPALLFYTFQRLNQPLTGALLAGAWALGVLAMQYRATRQIDMFAGLALTVGTVELLGTWLTRNPTIYLASAAIDGALWGLVFLGSLLLPRPLIQIFAEAMSGELHTLDEEFRRSHRYRAAWQILTAIWGSINLLKALVLTLAQVGLPLEAFLVLRTLLGTPLFVILLALSFWFPGWYWSRAHANP